MPNCNTLENPKTDYLGRTAGTASRDAVAKRTQDLNDAVTRHDSLTASLGDLTGLALAQAQAEVSALKTTIATMRASLQSF